MNLPKLSAPFFSYEDIRRKTEKFLTTYHASMTVPVPIEFIIDNHFRINIVPAPGIRENADVDGVISRDFKEIWVDENVYENNPHRYRFTLAHEVGHMILHEQIYKSLQFQSIADWKQKVPAQFEEREYSYFEIQANSFAGLVLVPPASLPPVFQKAVQQASRLLQDRNVLFSKNNPVIQGYVARLIADQFDVSPDTAEIRIARDKLWDSI
ncbi:MAG: ImmA/IrrE family metallo-endopeptidase [Elusimicrobia bacterium]|nr:ImmA/IrrE family metallo-endopeptidase [Elusimicrobiota bacterium]